MSLTNCYYFKLLREKIRTKEIHHDDDHKSRLQNYSNKAYGWQLLLGYRSSYASAKYWDDPSQIVIITGNLYGDDFNFACLCHRIGGDSMS